MTQQATLTPPDLPIPLRDLRFNREQSGHPHWWHGNDPVPTAFFNALSCTFPAGEKFFMDAVRAFRRDVSPHLQMQIKGFVAQEAVHSREHAAFNKLAADSGYEIDRLEARTKKVLDLARTRGKHHQLAATCALEHFTAMLAHELLANDSRDMDAAPADINRLWSWHAIEEIEHKAVTYDTFLAVTADWSGLRRYFLRTRAMILATLILYGTIAANMRDLYHQDDLRGLRVWGRTIKYLFGKNGILRRITPAWFSYFKPGFHPWQHDERALLAQSQQRLGLGAA
ncbi:metal-dependent hydrolase [Sphingomonas sp.]|uniref:metal-dependent hydrolase n=1 Tax=Sphingomonas sp. TaxID=28214 RepID=UPI003D6D5E6C